MDTSPVLAGSVELVHIVEFDTGAVPERLFSSDEPLGAIRDLLVASYRVSDDTLVSYSGLRSSLLKHYQRHFQYRIKPHFRSTRGTTLLEFKPICLRGLQYKQEVLVPAHTDIVMQVTASVNRLGVATLASRIEIAVGDIIRLGQQFRDAANLVTSAVDPAYGYSGTFSVEDLYRLLISEILLSLHRGDRVTERTRESIDRKFGSLEGLHAACLAIGGHHALPPRTDLVTFPVFIISSGLTGADLESEIAGGAREVRALLTGDMNWRFKRLSLVQEELRQLDVATRVAAPWYVGPDGGLCILASDYETDRTEAKTLVVFELELLLALKHYLLRINALLQRLRLDESELTAVSEIRELATNNLDEFYNLEMSHKDTTRSRIERCKSTTGIDDLQRTTFARMTGLSETLALRFQQRVVQRQTLLTLVFGVLGIGILVAQIELLAQGSFSWAMLGAITLPLALMATGYIALRWKLGGHRDKPVI